MRYKQKAICLVLAVMLAFPALATALSWPDLLSALSDEELFELQALVNTELADRGLDEGSQNLLTVYMTTTGSKYHSNPKCSNMKNPREVSLIDAISVGYEPCKKCYGGR